MGIMETIRNAFMGGYATSSITIVTVIICMACTVALSCYIYFVYKLLNRKTFYNKSFNVSLIIIALITAAIILTIQSNIVVSLGMVGALSIVRFRTAIKDPMDLAFLFWAISAGIICGAGFFMIAVIVSLVITVVVYLLSNSAELKESQVLVINATTFEAEREILNIVKENTKYMKVKAKNASKENLNMAIEVKTREESDLLSYLLRLESVKSASLVDHDGEITA